MVLEMNKKTIRNIFLGVAGCIVLYWLLHDEPNSEMTSFVLREVMLAHLLLYGWAYC